MEDSPSVVKQSKKYYSLLFVDIQFDGDKYPFSHSQLITRVISIREIEYYFNFYLRFHVSWNNNEE